MLLLVVLASLHLPTPTVSQRTHLADTLRLKCDSLPYRSTYADDQCFFAVLEEEEDGDASEQCSSILKGAKVIVTKNVPAAIFEKMVLEKTRFKKGSDSKMKSFICAYETGYKCDAPETMMKSGSCLIRATKKMNFVEANNYCHGRGMELPAPANDLDNRIVRDILVKDPTWVQKSLVQENRFKWSQLRDYSRWTTCDQPAANPRLYAGSQNAQWSCNKDTASVLDQHGYWNNGGVQNLMDVICVKPAVNEFTPEAKISCNYSADATQSEKLTPLPLASASYVSSKTCYRISRATKRYNIMGKATVPTQRGCEALCDSKQACAGFSFKEAGFSSECILLFTSTLHQTCPTPINIFLKQTEGCVARSNMMAEFGVDPCVDQVVSSASLGRPCPCDWRILVVRAIDANGNRVTHDNDWETVLEKTEDMWVLRFRDMKVPIVAATCAVAGGAKCPCKPIRKLTDEGQVFSFKPAASGGYSLPVGDYLRSYSVAKKETVYWYFPYDHTPGTYVTCKAGMWMLWHQINFNPIGITAMSCSP